MKIEGPCTVRFLFSACFPFEPAIGDAIHFPTDVLSFVRESGHAVLEQDVLKR